MRKKSRSLGWRGGGIQEASHAKVVHWGVRLGPITDIGGQPRHQQVGKDAQRLCVFSSHLQGSLARSPWCISHPGSHHSICWCKKHNAEHGQEFRVWRVTPKVASKAPN